MIHPRRIVLCTFSSEGFTVWRLSLPLFCRTAFLYSRLLEKAVPVLGSFCRQYLPWCYHNHSILQRLNGVLLFDLIRHEAHHDLMRRTIESVSGQWWTTRSKSL